MEGLSELGSLGKQCVWCGVGLCCAVEEIYLSENVIIFYVMITLKLL